MTETLKTRELRTVNVGQPLAARAIGSCEGCPMLALCATKVPGKCPPEILQDGGTARMVLEKVPPKSYRESLNDDSKPAVMAGGQSGEQQPTRRPITPIQSRKTPIQQKTPRTLPESKAQRRVGESLPEKVADLLMGLFVVSAVQKARAKK